MASGIFLLLLIAGLSGCGQKNTEKENLCHIVLEAGEGYHVTDPARTIKSGSDVSFTITLDDNWQFLGTDYHGETEITKEDDGKTVNLALHEVNYSESICIQAEKGKYEIVYDANGGQNISGDSDRVSICYRGTHQRINTSTGTDLFARDGYTLLGWNTRADGKGTRYLPGQTFKIKQNITLYAQWSLSYTVSSLIYRVTGRQTVTCYGTSNSRLNRVVIPLTIKCTGVTYKVTSVWTKAFTGKKNLTSVVIGNNVTTIGSQAFYNCKNLKAVTIGTGLTRIGSQAFRNVKAKCVITIKSQKLKAVSSKIDQGVKQMTVRVPKAKYSAYNRLLRKKSKSVIIKKF